MSSRKECNECRAFSALVLFHFVLIHSGQHRGIADHSRGVFPCWSTPVRPYLLTHPCFTLGGTVKCRCSIVTQDCSSNFGNLTYIPKLFNGVQVMNFSNNGLRRLTDDQFFVNVSRDVWLVDLYNNNMSFITPNVFRRLHKLRSVLIGGNRLSYDALKPVFEIPTLNNVDIKCGGLGAIPVEFFNQTPAVSLLYMDLSWNKVKTLDMHALQPLRNLQKFTLWHSHLYQLQTAYMSSLEYLSFHQNGLQDFPATCKSGTKQTLFPSLTELILDFNVISTIPDPVCLPKLEILSLACNRILYLSSYMFSILRFPSLSKVELTRMHGKFKLMKAYAFNNSRLAQIGLGVNYVDFSSSVVDSDVFAGCSGLRTLYLSYNNFKNVPDEKLHRLLRPLPRLEILHLAQAQIESITCDTFRHLFQLKRLYLYHNALSSLPDGAFDRLPSLRYLSIGSSRISKISSTTFGAQTRKRLSAPDALDLRGNPFDCSCDILWFQQWMRNEPRIFQDYGGVGYCCTNVPNKTVHDFYINKQACLLDRTTSVLIIASVCMLLSSFTLFTIFFGYRWHLKLWLYTICRGRYERSRRQADRRSRGFRYDVFLAYAEEDMVWVQNELLPVLEDRWRLRVCVHQRDFLPGKHILDNISDSVDESDRLLLVFSPHFARSQWCQFELRYCQSCVMERDDVMVLVALRETESRDMSNAMLAVLRTTTYIKWEEQPDAVTSFWGRLELALHDVIQQS